MSDTVIEIHATNLHLGSLFSAPPPLEIVAEDPFWVFPEGTLTGTFTSTGRILMIFEQASQQVRAIMEADVDTKLWKIAIEARVGDRYYVAGRFPQLDGDDQRNVITHLTLLP